MKTFWASFAILVALFASIFGVQCFYGHLFPMKFKDEVAVASEMTNLDSAVIFSVINVESHFNEQAISPKGAVGLMQVMPSTAKDVAKMLGKVDFDLASASDNILIGSKYLAYLCERFQNLDTAIVAYNAGPSNVAGWLKNDSYSTDGQTLAVIPFAESENYLAKFHKNYNYYRSKC